MDKLAVYIHWPYCARICPYCDFNVFKRREDDSLLPAILADLEYWRDFSGPRDITSIHFGGGTPSLMTPMQIGAVIEAVNRLWGADAVEIALEANPHEMNETDWRAYRDAGLNRMSLGVQSFQDSALSFLGRDHDGQTAQAALELALDIFPSVSADLIFGWAGQTEKNLDTDLDILLASDVPHISTYQLTIEEGTAFAKAEGRGQKKAVDADSSADLYERVRTVLTGAGYDHYEVSNFAKSGHRSRHNLAYWQGLDYIGVGPGAHGRLTAGGKRYATIAHLTPGDYVNSVSETGSGIESNDRLTPEEFATEYLLMGLRIEKGISLSRYAFIAGHTLSEKQMDYLISDGFLRRSGDRLSATLAGRNVLNSVTEKLLLG